MNRLALRMLLGFILASVLTIIPLPSAVAMVRPAWILLLVLYIQCFLPNYFNVAWVFLLGLYLDVMCATMMGEHAFAVVAATWFVSARIRRFKYYSMLHQMAMVGVFCLVYQSVLYMIDAFSGHTVHVWQVLGVPLTSMLFWPCLCVLLPLQQGRYQSSQWSNYYDL